MQTKEVNLEYGLAERYALDYCKENNEWYVLIYNTKTTEYLNDIICKPYEDAMTEYELTEPSSSDVVVEVIYSPDLNNKAYIDKFGEENIIIAKKEKRK